MDPEMISQLVVFNLAVGTVVVVSRCLVRLCKSRLHVLGAILALGIGQIVLLTVIALVAFAIGNPDQLRWSVTWALGLVFSGLVLAFVVVNSLIWPLAWMVLQKRGWA